VTAAVKLVCARGARKVFLVGASMGGAAVVVAGANTRPTVTGVVSLPRSVLLEGFLRTR
jgi:alpha-beta hydrolase superfamily lysophospholipase